MRNLPCIAREAAANASRPRIGGCPGNKNTTSSDIKPSTVSKSPAAEARNHVATKSRICCSSLISKASGDKDRFFAVSGGIRLWRQGHHLKRQRRAPYQPWATPKETATHWLEGCKPDPFFRPISKAMINHYRARMNRAYSPCCRFDCLTLGVAQGWYGAGPLALNK